MAFYLNGFTIVFIAIIWLFYKGSYGLTAHYLYACDIDVSVFKKNAHDKSERSQWHTPKRF